MKRKSQLVAMTLFALAFSACGESTNEAKIPAAEQKQVDPPAADVVPQRKAPRVISNEISDSDLGLGDPDNTTLEANGKSANVLEEAYEVIERYEDESVKRRWFVRLYVTFDRTKPWHQQALGSWVQHGEFEEFYPDGEQLLMQGNYREGKRDGKWTYWHTNGQVAKQGRYDNAQLTGIWQHFREDGTLLRTEEYAGHQKHGTWKFYGDDGTEVIREETYERDERVANNSPG